MTNRVKGAIFDFDGTLADTLWVWRKVDQLFLEQYGYTCDEAYVAQMRNLSFVEAAHWTLTHYNLPCTAADILHQWFNLAEQLYATSVTLKPGAKTYLNDLRESQIPFVLATSSKRAFCEPLLKANDIYTWFAELVTADEVAEAKREPTIFLAAQTALRLKPHEIVVFEDSLQAVQTAARAGFQTAAFYDEHVPSEFEAMKPIATWSLQNWTEALETDIFTSN